MTVKHAAGVLLIVKELLPTDQDRGGNIKQCKSLKILSDFLVESAIFGMAISDPLRVGGCEKFWGSHLSVDLIWAH